MNIGSFSKDTCELLNKNNINCEYIEDDISNIEILVSGRLKEDQLKQLPNLKKVIVPYSGLNGLCLQDLDRLNIEVYNLNFHSHLVAEKALTLCLTLLGNAINYHNNLKKGFWSDRHSKDRIYWESLFNKKVGIYGYGNIGKELHKLLKPFNVEVNIIKRNKEEFDVNYVKDLNELFKKSEIIFITIPLTKDTEGSINKNVLEDAYNKYIINVSRGKIIDEEALFNALNNEVIKGFASDVWYIYPTKNEITFPSAYPIDEFDNVVMSPHSGGFASNSSELREVALVKLINDILNSNETKPIEIKKYL